MKNRLLNGPMALQDGVRLVVVFFNLGEEGLALGDFIL
jgi:hypothetical protein